MREEIVMQTQTAVAMPREKSTGTPSSAPMDGAINLKPLCDALKELETAAQRVADMQAAYGEVLHAIAEKTGLAAPVIRSFIGARIAESDKARDKKKARAGQLALVFDEIGI